MIREVEIKKRVGRRSFISFYLDDRCDTFGIDADTSPWLLLDNLSGDSIDKDFRRSAEVAMISWGRENQIFNRQFRGKTVEKIIDYQTKMINNASRGFNDLLDLEGALTSSFDYNLFVQRIINLEILPAKELSQPGLYLNPDKAEEFLANNFPEKLLTGSKYSRLEELFEKYSPALVAGLARRSEDFNWLYKYETWVKSLKSEDLINKTIEIKVIDRNEFPSLHEVMKEKMANDDRLSGTVWLLTPEVSTVKTPIELLRQTIWLLHYVFELHNFGTKFSNQFDSEMFEVDCHLAAVFSPGMSKSRSENKYFDVHALMEGVFWQKSFLALSRFNQHLTDVFKPDYPGIDKLVIVKGEQDKPQIIGFHPANMITNTYTGKVTTNSTTKRVCKLGILQQILNNMSLDEVEDLLINNLEKGHIGI